LQAPQKCQQGGLSRAGWPRQHAETTWFNGKAYIDDRPNLARRPFAKDFRDVSGFQKRHKRKLKDHVFRINMRQSILGNGAGLTIGGSSVYLSGSCVSMSLRLDSNEPQSAIGNPPCFRRRALRLTFNGREVEAYEGETLAGALWAAGCRAWRVTD